MFLKKSLLLIVLGSYLVVSGQNYESDFQSRATKLINYVADDYKWDASGWYNCNPSDYGKYNWQIVVASFEKYGVTNTKGNQYLPHFNTPSCIQNRFHFNLVGETYIFTKYWNAPSVKSNIKDYLTAAWNRTDSYNLMTSEGTENHLNMTRTAAYLYAQIARDSFPADFPNAKQRLDSAKTWILDWAKTLYASGSGEWNSSTYQPFNINGWLALYEGAKDAEIHTVAKAVLDYFACEMALHYSQGIVGGYESRNGNGYESNITEGDYLSWLWFGDSPRKIAWAVGSQDNQASQSIYAAASSYRPPLAAVRLAQKKLAKNVMYYNSKGEYLMNNPGAVKQTFYIGKTYTLGAAYLPYGGFTGGDTQFQMWKFVGKTTVNETVAAKTANLIVGYGSKEWNKARARMPWDQVVHHKNVLVQMTKVPANYTTVKTQIDAIISQWQSDWARAFDKRFPFDGKGNPVTVNGDVSNSNFSYMAVWKKNNTVTTVTKNNIAFYEMDSNYVAIRSIAQTSPTVTIANDNYALKDAATQGNLCGLVLEVGSKLDYNSFVDFQNAIVNNSSLNKSNISQDNIIYTSATGDVLAIQYNSSGTFTEPLYDWGYGPVTKQLAQKSPPFIQPTWPSGEGFGRIASWSVNGNTVDLSTDWGVFGGANLLLKNSVLRLNAGSSDSLHIDFTATLPQYMSSETTAYQNLSQNKPQFSIYPNPATETLNTELICSYRGSVIVELFDLSGRSVFMVSREKNAEKQIFSMPLSKKYKGLYLLKIKAGDFVTTQRVQIE